MGIPPRLCSNTVEDANKNNCNMIQTSELFIKARYHKLKGKYFHEKNVSVFAHMYEIFVHETI